MVKRPKLFDPDDPGEPAEQPEPEALAAVAPSRQFTYRSFDGLLLSAMDYGSPISPWLPVVCLPGLTRTGRDFADLAQHLAMHRYRPRRVVCFDYRGRGLSQWDRDRDNYNPVTEMNDVLDGMAALGLTRAIIVGTSRGGIIAMLMGVARPAAIAGVVLNDIGPVIEPRGLARLKTYVGRTPQPDDWADALRIQKRLHSAQFSAWKDDDWSYFARLTYADDGGRPVIDHDPALGRTFDGVEFDRPIPALWDHFRALSSVPVLAIRGENSDMLSAATLSGMAAAHPSFQTVTIAGEGHPPLLRASFLLNRISAFAAAVEGGQPPAESVIPREPTAFDLDAQPAPQAQDAEASNV